MGYVWSDFGVLEDSYPSNESCLTYQNEEIR